MANVDRAVGFRFAKSLTGHAPNAMARKYPVTVNATRTALTDGAIYLGDAVTLTSAGLVLPFTTGDACLGVVVGVASGDGVEMGQAGPFNPDDLTQRYLPETEAGSVWVIPADDNLFEVQGVDAPAATVYADTADVTPDSSATHGDTTTSRSIMEIAFTTPTNNDVTVVEFDTIDNDTTLVDGKYLVKFNSTFGAQS